MTRYPPAQPSWHEDRVVPCCQGNMLLYKRSINKQLGRHKLISYASGLWFSAVCSRTPKYVIELFMAVIFAKNIERDDRFCGLVVRVPGYTMEMYCASCEVRTEFILCYVEESRPPLWSSGQSYWLHNGDVLCFLWCTNWIYICYVEESRPPGRLIVGRNVALTLTLI
jgi:hypothetical protein